MNASTALFLQVLQAAKPPPVPGAFAGATLQRWRQLAALAAQDLAACKLAEAHWDALAILQDLERPALARGADVWAVWAADNPKAPLRLQRGPDGDRLQGIKAWCSGAEIASHALLTCEDDSGNGHFVLLALQAPGITLDHDGWQALGMRHVRTARIAFDATPVTWLGERGRYLQRPGFWHGGAGIAACWYGAACRIAQLLRTRLAAEQPHAAAHLGAMFTELRAARALLWQLAERIDAAPQAPWIEEVQAVRGCVRRVAGEVMERSARALGPAPLCAEAEHAQRCADLQVWCTQQHAEKDDAGLGLLAQSAAVDWEL